MSKIIVKQGRVLVFQGKLVTGDSCDCDPCGRWWCVYDFASPEVTYCVQSASQPPNAVGGPYDSESECDLTCSPWWCVDRDGVRQCVISSTQPPDQVPGTSPHGTQSACLSQCNSGGYWCVYDGTSFNCVYSATKPTGAINTVPYATSAECQQFCSTGCGISYGSSDLPGFCSGYNCREWFDDCTGGTQGDCNGWLLPNNGYYLGQFDPPGSLGDLRPSYESPACLDMYSHGVPILIRSGLTIRNSARPEVGFQCGGGFLKIDGWAGLGSSGIPDTLLYWNIYSLPLPGFPGGAVQNQFSIVGQWFPTPLWGVLPFTPAAGDRMEAYWQIDPPSIAIGDTEYKTTYTLLNLFVYRGNTILWVLAPTPAKQYRRTPLCLGRLSGCGTGRTVNMAGSIVYAPTACDDIYWDIQGF